jgi:hypothetical protein
MPTFTCTITIDKSAGILVVVEDKENSRKQSINMTGESIVTTVCGEKTSVITQEHNHITVDVETFTLNADAVAINAAKTIALKTDSDAISLESGKDLAFKATAKGTFECADAELKAQTSWKQESPSLSIAASTKLECKSDAAANFEGAQVSIKGSATVAIQSSGSAEIKGSAITASAPMIKLG